MILLKLFSGRLRLFWEKEYTPWVLTLGLLVASYMVAVHEMYNIVGGLVWAINIAASWTPYSR